MTNYYVNSFANSWIVNVSGRRVKSISDFISFGISNPAKEFRSIFLRFEKAAFTILLNFTYCSSGTIGLDFFVNLMIA